MVMGEVSRGPCRPASPSLQEGALKAGWLKKQRSIMKNWQLRWFVLRSDQLFFYKDEEETKPQVILLQPHLCNVEYTDRTVKSNQDSSLLFGLWTCIYTIKSKGFILVPVMQLSTLWSTDEFLQANKPDSTKSHIKKTRAVDLEIRALTTALQPPPHLYLRLLRLH